MIKQSQIRKFVRDLYIQVYKVEPTEQQERDFAEHGVVPVLVYLMKQEEQMGKQLETVE